MGISDLRLERGRRAARVKKTVKWFGWHLAVVEDSVVRGREMGEPLDVQMGEQPR